MAQTPFARLEKRLSASVDRVNAERVRLEPRRRGNGPVVGADTSRQAREFSAIVDRKPVLANARSSTRYNGAEATLNADELQASATTDALGPREGWPVVGDHIRMLDEEGQPAASVTKVNPDGMGRVVFNLIWVK
jgi:hypothetical protein